MADAGHLPLASGSADVVVAYNSLMDVDEMPVAFMSLHDVDDYQSAVREAARILWPPGRLCIALVHPINSAGRFEGKPGDANAPFVIRGSYLESFRYTERAERDNLGMTFHSQHHPLEAYGRALEEAGFLIEAIRDRGGPSQPVAPSTSLPPPSGAPTGPAAVRATSGDDNGGVRSSGAIALFVERQSASSQAIHIPSHVFQHRNGQTMTSTPPDRASLGGLRVRRAPLDGSRSQHRLLSHAGLDGSATAAIPMPLLGCLVDSTWKQAR